jgi:hypothetical protein
MIACMMVLLFCQWKAIGQRREDQVVTKQCSVIRELVYAGATAKFEPIRMDQVRGSSGYQTRGSWQFSTTRYNASIAWQGADISYLEHSEESTDSTRLETWQYIAEYSHVPDVLEASRIFNQLNDEIEGCAFPVDDTTDLAFVPLPPERLPADRPPSLQVAKVYELPLPGQKAASEKGAVMVMVGMEKRAKDYRVSLIVENRSN